MRPIRIAVCDDDETICEATESALRRKWKDEIALCRFRDGQALADHYRERQRPFDIILLDIYMKELNGVETARQIRKSDDEVAIIFLTSSDAHLLEGYGVHAFQYLLKPIATDALWQAVGAAIDRVSREEESIVVKTGREYEKLTIAEITRVEVDGKSLNFYRQGEEPRKVPGSMKEILPSLAPHGFAQIHSGCAVNLRHVRTVSAAQRMLELEDGTRLPISRRVATQVASAFFAYKRGEGL